MPRPSWGLHRGDGAMTARAPVFVIKSKWGPLLSWAGSWPRQLPPVDVGGGEGFLRQEAEQGLLFPLCPPSLRPRFVSLEKWPDSSSRL